MNSPESPANFEQIYQDAALRPQRLTCTILKVAEMAESPYLSGMSSESKRASILMALEMAGADINALLDDAVSRQRSLNEHEETLLRKQKEFEAIKSAEAARSQEELERTRAEGMARIRVHLDEVTREQEAFRVWQKRREVESARITGAALVCVPEGAAKGRDGLAALLERSVFPPR